MHCIFFVLLTLLLYYKKFRQNQLFQVYLFTLEDNYIILKNRSIVRFNSPKRTQKSSKM